MTSSTSDQDVTTALADFDAVWESLSPREQTDALGLLVEKIDYDAGIGNVAITFHQTGLKALGAVQNLEGSAA